VLAWWWQVPTCGGVGGVQLHLFTQIISMTQDSEHLPIIYYIKVAGACCPPATQALLSAARICHSYSLVVAGAQFWRFWVEVAYLLPVVPFGINTAVLARCGLPNGRGDIKDRGLQGVYKKRATELLDKDRESYCI